MKNEEKVIVALDTAHLIEAEALLKKLKGLISFYKIGLELFSAQGWKAVELVRKYGARIFLDLKLHDIPTTVHRTVRVISSYGVEMTNIHALGGLEMMRAAREAAGPKTALLGVTILTSLTQETLRGELGISGGLKERVLALTDNAKKASLDGVVCSPLEIKEIRQKTGPDFLIVTPGIRPENAEKNDQKRTLTPKEALRAGTSYLVIGRAITCAEDSRKAAQDLLESM